MRAQGLSVLTLTMCAGVLCLGQIGPPFSTPQVNVRPASQGQAPPRPAQTEFNSSSTIRYSRVIDGVTHTFAVNTTGGPPAPGLTALSGAPYSGEEIEGKVQTLVDGSQLTTKMLMRRTYRDSQGRERIEQVFPPGSDPESQPAARNIRIQDPVANVQYMLDVGAKLARRWDMSKVPNLDTIVLAPLGISHGEGLPPSPPPRAMAAGSMPAPPTPPARPPGMPPVGSVPQRPDAPKITSERLGTQAIDGVTVEGTRTTVTNPPGSEGSDRPIVTVSEQWTSPELRVTVLSISKDPRQGVTTRRIIHLSRFDPDASLFQPPPDYQIMDQTIAITIDHQVSK